MKSQKTFEGNIIIDKNNFKEWEKKLEYTEKITGDLSINSNCELPKLTSVGGGLSINSNSELQAPKLTSVGGGLYIYSNSELQAPKLTSVGGGLYINSNSELPKLTSVGGDLSIYSNSELQAPKLTSVGGYLSIYSKIPTDLEKRLFKKNKKNKWYVCNLCSDWLLSQKGNFIYKIDNVEFPKEWFDKIRKDKLTPEEVFAIDNIEHRRIAFAYMDKIKMKSLKDFKILDERIDEKENPMKIISFTIQSMEEPLKFYNCICPSSKREYFVGTDKDTCLEAKAACWGFGKDEIDFVNEW